MEICNENNGGSIDSKIEFFFQLGVSVIELTLKRRKECLHIHLSLAAALHLLLELGLLGFLCHVLYFVYFHLPLEVLPLNLVACRK